MKVSPDAGSGKRGPYIYQGGRYGRISRILVIPSNPRTAAQSASRTRLAYVASRWNGLTEPERRAWAITAQQLQAERPLEQSRLLRGLELFARVNCARLINGLAEVRVPPPRPAFGALPVTGLTITNASGLITLRLSVSSAPAEGTMLRAAAPCSQGRYTPKWVAYVGTLPPPTDGGIDITALYTARFGAPPVGSKVFVRINQNLGGWEDAPQQFNAIVPAG